MECMKETLKLYWTINPLSRRIAMLRIFAFGAIISGLILSMNTNASIIDLSGVFYSGYFLFLGIYCNDTLNDNKKDQLISKNLLLQMSNQKHIFVKGIIFESVLYTIIYILIEVIIMGICGLFMGFQTTTFVVCLWYNLITSILTIYASLAKANSHNKIGGAITFILCTLFIIGVFNKFFDYSIQLPDYFMKLQGLPVLFLIYLFFLSCSVIFGKYFYNNRKEKRVQR